MDYKTEIGEDIVTELVIRSLVHITNTLVEIQLLTLIKKWGSCVLLK